MSEDKYVDFENNALNNSKWAHLMIQPILKMLLKKSPLKFSSDYSTRCSLNLNL